MAIRYKKLREIVHQLPFVELIEQQMMFARSVIKRRYLRKILPFSSEHSRTFHTQVTFTIIRLVY
ncbi:Uncharacterised protein [Lysinibacillus sphaericus]|nr:Uncharacterised protein [Lysinibacillus sphaericus]